MSQIKIAIDAMGGDNSLDIIIKGAMEGLKENPGLNLIFVGREKEIRRELKKIQKSDDERIEVVDALESVLMRERFFSYWRKRDRTSIKKALDLVKHEYAQAMVSIGNTGAVMAIAKTVLSPLENIERPALSIMIPTLKGSSLLMDVGANVDSKPKNLVQSALMGKIYLENVKNIKNPKIALMSIGEEEDKGNQLIKTTYNLLKIMDINFIGNIEGKDVYRGDADLIITDGFTGNITLKVSEGLVEAMLSMLNHEIMSNLLSKIGFFFLKSSLKRIRKKLDYAEYGGALLLGVNGIVIIGHGRSSSKAIKNAVILAKKFITENVLEKISQEIEKMQDVFKELKHV